MWEPIVDVLEVNAEEEEMTGRPQPLLGTEQSGVQQVEQRRMLQGPAS